MGDGSTTALTLGRELHSRPLHRGSDFHVRPPGQCGTEDQQQQKTAAEQADVQGEEPRQREVPSAGPGPPMAIFSRLSPTQGRKVRKPVRVFVAA